LGPTNIIKAIQEHQLRVHTVVGVSTDKACKPINVMGMTKALQERVFIGANITIPKTRFICVRYGNVLASRGSVIPLFLDQIKRGGPVTITTKDMTRFLIPLEKAVEVIVAAILGGQRGETYIPQIGSTSMVNLAKAMIGTKPIRIEYTGIRPGEKVYESLVAAEEAWRTVSRGKYYVIKPLLPELKSSVKHEKILTEEYNSAIPGMSVKEIKEMLEKYNLLNINTQNGEILV